MKMEKGMVITLDNDPKYLIVSIIEHNNNQYLYLININNNADIKICSTKVEDNQTKVAQVKDEPLLKELVVLFSKDIASSTENV